MVSRYFVESRPRLSRPTFYKVDFYIRLSTCNEVTFSWKCLIFTSLLCLQTCHHKSRNVRVINPCWGEIWREGIDFTPSMLCGPRGAKSHKIVPATEQCKYWRIRCANLPKIKGRFIIKFSLTSYR